MCCDDMLEIMTVRLWYLDDMAMCCDGILEIVTTQIQYSAQIYTWILSIWGDTQTALGDWRFAVATPLWNHGELPSSRYSWYFRCFRYSRKHRGTGGKGRFSKLARGSGSLHAAQQATAAVFITAAGYPWTYDCRRSIFYRNGSAANLMDVQFNISQLPGHAISQFS